MWGGGGGRVEQRVWVEGVGDHDFGDQDSSSANLLQPAIIKDQFVFWGDGQAGIQRPLWGQSRWF